MRIVGATVVTCDPAGTVPPDGEVEVRDGQIGYVGPSRGPAGEQDIDATGHVVVPGLVNAHTHSAMTLLRGTSDDADLTTWLGAVQGVEQHLTATDLRAGLRLAMVEMIRTGTTAFADMYHWDADLAGEVVAAGMRAVIAPAAFDPGIVGFPHVLDASGPQVLDHTDRLAADLAGEPLLTVRYGPHATYTCSGPMLAEVADRARRTGLGVHIHLSESADEVRHVRRRHGGTPVAVAARAGLLEVPTLVAHAVHLETGDIDLLATGAAHGVSVAHNPVSNLKLGSGIAPVPQMLAAGVRVGLGTDGAASNNDLDLLEEVKTGTIVHRGVRERADMLRSHQVLAMATREGAGAVGLTGTGTLAAGQAADLVVLDATGAVPTIGEQPATSWLAFVARGCDVRHVLVAGRPLLRDGVLTTLDEPAVRAEAARAATDLRRRAAEPAGS